VLLIVADSARQSVDGRRLIAARFVVDAESKRHSFLVYGLRLSLAESFDFFPLRFHFRASKELHFAEGTVGNRLRGALGKNLKAWSEEAYERWFAPSGTEGPSGLRDRPRPFVLRAAHLDGAKIRAGAEFCVGLNVFDSRAIDDLTHAMSEFDVVEKLENGVVRLGLEPCDASRIRVRFLTPTELKGSERPEFGVLWARVRDRISTLRAFYGAGPLAIDFRAMGERAARVRMTRSEIKNVAAERVSRSSGQRHSIGGFIGFAEYAGELGEFVAYLEIARHTGVGRQTVWGKGEIGVETF
jgi:CRISPR-associated endoribonuclease Cas6